MSSFKVQVNKVEGVIKRVSSYVVQMSNYFIL